jgi:D-3-phosphoglycerate dehydrogenase
MHVVALDFPGWGSYEAEQQAVEELAGSLQVVAYGSFLEKPVECEVLLNVGGYPFPAEQLERLIGTQCMVVFSVGIDSIDVERATELGVLITYMPVENVEEVASHALALALACARRLGHGDRHMRHGGFDWNATRPARRLSECRLGVLGFGNNGRALCRMALPLFQAVAAHDPYVPAETMREHSVEALGLEDLLRTSDVLSVHAPLTPETRGLLNRERLGLLPEGAIVVVTSRGAIYDPDALVSALNTGRLAGAGLDVFPEEPLQPQHPLRRCDKVILTPHMAGYSEETIRDQHLVAAEALRALARGETPRFAVNAPS